MFKAILGLLVFVVCVNTTFASEGFAVLPFSGTAHSQKNLVLAGSYLTKRLQQFIEKRGLSDKGVIVDFEKIKSMTPQGTPYDKSALRRLSRELGVRYLLFGESKQIYLGFRYHRFNVYCKAFDVESDKIIDIGHSRYSSTTKLIVFSSYPVLRPKEWKTLAKLSEPFQVFIKERLGGQRAD